MCARPSGAPGAPKRDDARSGDDIGGQLVLNHDDPVAQLKFALFQALHLENVAARDILQSSDRHIKVAMLLLQPRELRAELAFFLLRHLAALQKKAPAQRDATAPDNRESIAFSRIRFKPKRGN